MKKQIALVGALFLACANVAPSFATPVPQAVTAESGHVKGTVVDENGEPIILSLIHI